MSFLTKHQNGLVPPNRAAFRALLFCPLFVLCLPVAAQISNGVFDPSKVMVAKEKVKQVSQIEHNIALSNEFNRTLGTPDHPRPNAPEPETPADMRAQAGPTPPSIPDFDLPPDVRKRNEARSRKRRSREKPFVEANKLEEPMVSANPVSIRGVTPAFDNPVPEPGPDGSNPDLELASAPESGQRGFFSRFKKSRTTLPGDIDVSSTDVANPDLPPGEVSVNGELDHLPADDGMVLSDNGEMIPSGGFDLPSYADEELPGGGRKSSFLSMFSRPRTPRTFDVPANPIPISIGSGNSGNPYSNKNFQAGSGYSPLLDDPSDRGKMRDMTQQGVLPFGDGISQRMGEKPLTDVSQYLIAKEDTKFEPFVHGTEDVDKDNAFEIYSGMTVRDLGIKGLKRMVQVDSGEIGLIAKFAVRQLSVSEEVVMSEGLTGGRPWYSILDTEAEYDEFAANLSSAPMTGKKPQRPGTQQSPKPSNGKSDSDVSQYSVVKRSGVTFGPFTANSEEVDLSASFEMPTGAIVKIIKTDGNNHVVQSDSGEVGIVPVDGVRPLNESEETLMAGGIASGRPWYSILDTEADLMASARKPSPPMLAPAKPKPNVPKPQAIAAKPESDVTQYFLVKKDGILFQPFSYGTQQIEANSSFEMYEGAIVKVLSTRDDKHIVRTDSGETGVISVDGIRPLNDKEKEHMAKGIAGGDPWYSVLDTLAE
ncbi:MAG: hypothetical protein P1V20_19210 [Verrucomicrobiales bacterium]|nr:hypothetical protein [Verrucomicrobiales bacterium]